MVGVWVVVYIVVEEDRGDTGTLWYPHPQVSVWGFSVIVPAIGHPSLKVSGQPAHCVVSE